jgi:hypothetical protein
MTFALPEERSVQPLTHAASQNNATAGLRNGKFGAGRPLMAARAAA